MANELVKVELYGQNNDGCPRRYTIADGTAVSKGTLLALSDPRTAAPVTTYNSTVPYCAGVASEDHVASEGVTSISAWTDGIFEAVASGAIAIGSPVIMVEGNRVQQASYLSGANALGYALETATDTETINVRVQL